MSAAIALAQPDSGSDQPPAPQATSRRVLPGPLSALIALLAYGAIAAAMFPGVVAHMWTAFPGDLGDPPSQAWILAWDLHALTHGLSHLYDANIFYPFHDVLAYQDTLLGLLPLSGPLLWLSGSPVFTYNTLFLASFALCGLGAYLLARALTGKAGAAFVGGLIYGFSPYRMVHLYHLNLLSGMWLPLALLCWEQVRRGRQRYWLGVGIFFVLQALSALYYAAFLAVTLAVMLALHLRRARGRAAPGQVRRIVRGAAVTLVGGAIVLWPFLLPYLRVERSLGAARGLAQAVYFSADLRDFLHSVDLSVLYGWTGRALGVGPTDALQYLWPGLVALGLAVWGLRRAWGRLSAPHAAYALTCVGAAILCLGPFLKVWGAKTPLPLPYLALYWLPGFAGLRDPARFGAIYTLCLAVLAAYGVAALGRRTARPLRGRAGVLPALTVPYLFGSFPLQCFVLCLGVLAESWINPLPVAALPVGAQVPPVYRWLAAQPAPAPVLELPIGLDNKAVWARQAEMMYYTTVHWQPIVNGTGGFAPPGYAADVAVYDSFPSARSVTLLRARAVRYVVVHRDWLGPAAANAIRRRAAHTAGVRLVHHWSDDDLYALTNLAQHSLFYR